MKMAACFSLNWTNENNLIETILINVSEKLEGLCVDTELDVNTVIIYTQFRIKITMAASPCFPLS